MIKTCFKLDVETSIDREFSDVLKDNIALIKSSMDRDKQIKYFGSEELIETEDVLYNLVERQPVIDYKMRNEWETERNNNLSCPDKITLIVKCSKCLQIYPYSFDIEKSSLKEIPCFF
jgi:hypothetical protein